MPCLKVGLQKLSTINRDKVEYFVQFRVQMQPTKTAIQSNECRNSK